jgi:hypothetical protein
VTKLREQVYEGQTVGYVFWCPACNSPHPFRIVHYSAAPDAPLWQFNGNLESPTFTPSLRLHRTSVTPECHVNVTDGQIQFHGDCDHEWKGRTVPLVDFPEGWG